jgi:hypothetical protein
MATASQDGAVARKAPQRAAKRRQNIELRLGHRARADHSRFCTCSRICSIATFISNETFVSSSAADFDPSVLDALLTIASALNVAVVAEGIENSIQLEHLRARKCTRGQGFLLARPLPISDAEAVMGICTADEPPFDPTSVQRSTDRGADSNRVSSVAV